MGVPVGRPRKSAYSVKDSVSRPSSFRVKTVSDDASSSWRYVKVSYVESKRRGLIFRSSASTSRPDVEVFLQQDHATADLLLHDSIGDGWYDTVTHIGAAASGDDGSTVSPMLALDTFEDGKADTLVLDSTGDGRYDRVYNRHKAPLSFLATMAKHPSSGKSRKHKRQRSDPGLSIDSDLSMDDDEALAPGWEKRMSKSQNNFYYFNKATKRSTWDASEAELPPWPHSPPRPHSPPNTPSHSTSAGLLNQESEASIGSDGGHALAPDWERKWSQTKNKYYYCNTVSGHTTWDIKEAMYHQSVEHPIYWRHSGRKGEFLELVNTSSIFNHVQMLLASTFLFTRTRDRKEKLPNSLEALRIWRVENSEVWRRYAACRAPLRQLVADSGRHLPGCDPMPKTSELLTHDLCGTLPETMRGHKPLSSFDEPPPPTVDRAINEVYLFHGTSPAGALGIVSSGFDISKAALTACYGPGIYFAECSSKSDEYSCVETDGLHQGHAAMLLCRVLLGRVLQWQTEFSPELAHAWASGEHDSILGDRLRLRGTYREFVLPPDSAHGAYPEYLIIYRRRYDD